jgi:hypothetical protein
MRFRTSLPRLLALIVAASAALNVACSKDSDTVAIKDIGDADLPHKFTPDPLGTIPPMDTSDPAPMAIASAAPPASAAASGSARASASAAPKASAAAAASAAPAAAPNVMATVKLLSPGDAPRKKLRYKFKVGQQEFATLDWQNAISIEAGAQSQPEKKVPMVRFKIQIDPKSVSPEGDMKYEYRLVATDVAESPTVAPQLAAALKQFLGGLRGLSGTGTISARGITKDSSFTPPADGNEQTDQLAEVVRLTMSDIATAFPDEEVGKNAKWEKSMKVDSPGANAKAVAKETYTLVDLTGDTGKVEVVLLQNAPGGTSALPGIPSNAGIRVESFVANGKGTSGFDMVRLVPATSTDLVSTVFLVADRNGQTEKAKMITKVTARLTGSLK